jgi:Holliday junction resolvase RuvA-like protein
MSRRRAKRKGRRSGHGLAWQVAAAGSHAIVKCWKAFRAAQIKENTHFAPKEPRARAKKRAECLSIDHPVSVDCLAQPDAVSALVNLGFRRSEASRVIAAAVRSEGTSAGTATLIRRGLRELAK